MTSFAERIDTLKAMVGDGYLDAEITVNQVYAHYQDSGAGPHGKPAALFIHPRGGEAGYLSGQVAARRDEVISAWARTLLREGPIPTTVRLVNSFCDQVYARAPREFWILRNSAAGKVHDNGRPTFDRPPMMPRLSQAELNAIRRAAGGDALRGSQRQRTSRRFGGALTHDLGTGRVR